MEIFKKNCENSETFRCDKATSLSEDVEWIAQRHQQICAKQDALRRKSASKSEDDGEDDDMSQSSEEDDEDDDAVAACLELYRISDFYNVKAASNGSSQHEKWTELCDRFAQIEDEDRFIRAQMHVMEACRIVALRKLNRKSRVLPSSCQRYLDLWRKWKPKSKVWRRWTKTHEWGPSTYKKTVLHGGTSTYKRKGNAGRKQFWGAAQFVPLISFDTIGEGTTDWALDLRNKMPQPTTQQSFHLDHRRKLREKYKGAYALVPDHEQGLQCAYDLSVASRRAKSTRDSARWPTTPHKPSIIPKLDKSRVRPFLCRRNVSFNLNVDD